MEEKRNALERSLSPHLFILGFVLALVAMGLPMIGITVNLYLGALALSIAFALLAFGFWKWRKRRIGKLLRELTHYGC